MSWCQPASAARWNKKYPGLPGSWRWPDCWGRHTGWPLLRWREFSDDHLQAAWTPEPSLHSWLRRQRTHEFERLWKQKPGCSSTHPCGLCWSSAWPGSSAGQSEAWAPAHCWCLTSPEGWAASSPAPAPHHSELMPTRTKDPPQTPSFYFGCSL